jgi:hypothetical protein
MVLLLLLLASCTKKQPQWGEDRCPVVGESCGDGKGLCALYRDWGDTKESYCEMRCPTDGCPEPLISRLDDKQQCYCTK